MSSAPVEPADLLDLKLLPAWVKEPAEAKSYAHYTGDEGEERRPRGHDRRSRDGGDRRGKPASGRDGQRRGERPTPRPGKRPSGSDRPSGSGNRQAGPDKRRPGFGNRPSGSGNRQSGSDRAPLDITIRFLPRVPAFENVVAQIQSGAVAYSLFHLARLFLEKPERYEVRLTTKPELPLYQLGENGAISFDRQFLDQNAFRLTQAEFYKIDITQGEPIKGNFMSVARDRLSGTLLGPTNHHAYQPRLRTLYEQRFSRRMSFADYQRQIEIVSDPALVERWKEEAQKVTTYTTLREETPVAFTSAAEVERHFQANYLPGLVRSVEEFTTGGVLSRALPDRAINRAIEDAWAREIRSPSNMMQELASRFRQDGLNIFRHRRGMLFVSPIRMRPLVHEEAGVSPTVNAILAALAAAPGINRKDLAGKLIVEPAGEDAEPRKLALASDLHWLISAGHVIEFNDGSLDLPRGKTKATDAAGEQTPETTGDKNVAVAVAPTTESTEPTGSTESRPTDGAEPGEPPLPQQPA